MLVIRVGMELSSTALPYYALASIPNTARKKKKKRELTVKNIVQFSYRVLAVLEV
jgi:hypothetical protein